MSEEHVPLTKVPYADFLRESALQYKRTQPYGVSQPSTPYFRFAGPNVDVSCEIAYDKEEGIYVARTEAGFVGTGHTQHVAALMCFLAWNTDMHAYFYQPDETPDHGGYTKE